MEFTLQHLWFAAYNKVHKFHFVFQTHPFLTNSYVVIIQIQIKEASFAIDRYVTGVPWAVVASVPRTRVSRPEKSHGVLPSGGFLLSGQY